MMIPNPDYTYESIEFEEGDYLKQISGCVNKAKNFKYFKFVSAKGKSYTIGSYNRETYEDETEKVWKDRMWKIKIGDMERPVCINVGLNPIKGKLPTTTEGVFCLISSS